MAYDPYQSLLASASRERLKRSADLNTHLVGNVFLPAIDAQHKKKSSEPTASLKHLKVIEQCIKAENKREERLAKCTTIRERKIMTTKFQAQRERERDLIQALMLGNYPERNLEVELSEKQAAVATSPRQQLNHDSTGLSSRVATPDRVFRKADFTGASTAKPHAHKKFKLPECNGSPGRKVDAKEQQAASVKLSSPPRKAPTSAEPQPAPIRKKRSPSRSAGVNSVSSPKIQAEAGDSPKRAPSSLHRHQPKSATASVQLSSLPSKPAEEVKSENTDTATANKDFPVVFERAASFSEAQRLADAMGSDAQLLKEKCERILAEMATQTTARLAQDDSAIKETLSPPELPPIDLTLSTSLDVPATTPRRPQSDRVYRSTRQSFLDNLAREDEILQERKEAALLSSDTNGNLGREGTREGQDEDKIEAIANEEEVEAQGSASEEEDEAQHNADEEEDTKSALNPDDTASEEEYDDDFTEAEASSDEETDPEADVAETLLNLVNIVEARVTEQAKQKVVEPSPRIVSPRPRSSMIQTNQHMHVVRIQSIFRGYRARIAFRLALYEDALSCGVLGAMPGTIQGRSGWYLDPKRLMAYYFVIPDPDGEWEQKFAMRCSRMVLTPYEMRAEVLSKAPKDLLQVIQEYM